MYSEIEKQLRRKLSSMKHRCYAKNLDPSTAKHYRDKGIRVCGEWLDDPNEFVKWSLENGYKVGLTIDRIDPEGNYEPSNCQWITLSENSKKAVEDTRKRRAREAVEDERSRRELAEFGEQVRAAGSLSKYFWLEMYDELEEEERADIRLAVSVLGMLKLCDESASMLDAFVCSKNLVERLKEEQKNAKDEKERLNFALKLTFELADTIKAKKGAEK